MNSIFRTQDQINTLLSRMFAFYKVDGVVYVADNNGIVISKEDAKELIDGLQQFLDSVDDQFIEDTNNAVMKKDEHIESTHMPKSNRDKQRVGFVYFIKADNGMTKIGRAVDIESRLDHFTTKLPYELELIHTIKTNDYVRLEQQLHEEYKMFRERGEWFKLTKKQMNEVKKKYGKSLIFC